MGKGKKFLISGVLVFVLSAAFLFVYRTNNADAYIWPADSNCFKYTWAKNFCRGDKQNSDLCQRVSYNISSSAYCGNYQPNLANITWSWWNSNCSYDSVWYDKYCLDDWWNQQYNNCCIYMYPILYDNYYQSPWPSYQPNGITLGWWEKNCPRDSTWYDRYCRYNAWNQSYNNCCIYWSPILYGNRNNCTNTINGITWNWWSNNCPRDSTWYDRYCQYNTWNQQHNSCCKYMYPKLYGSDRFCRYYYQLSSIYYQSNSGWYHAISWVR